MKIFLDNENFLRVCPETPEDGFQLGSLYNATISQALAGLLTFPNGGPDMLIDVVQLVKIEQLLGWQGSGKGRVDRIRELLDIERATRSPSATEF